MNKKRLDERATEWIRHNYRMIIAGIVVLFIGVGIGQSSVSCPDVSCPEPATITKEVPKEAKKEKPKPAKKQPTTHGGLSTNRTKVLTIIKTNAKEKWGSDYSMVQWEIDKQTEAYDWLIRQTKHLNIMVNAENKWGEDYAMVQWEYEKQVEAYKAIQ